MDSQEFIDVLRIVVRDVAASGVLDVLEKPPGRKPDRALQERARWYGSLNEDQKRILSAVVLHAVDSAIFGFLCVLDGVRAIENGQRRGRLELRYVKDDAVLLNPPDGEMLHDLW